MKLEQEGIFDWPEPSDHETLHFWQLIDSFYLLKIVEDFWKQLLHYEAQGEVLLKSPVVKGFQKVNPYCGFSAYQLMECWARFWDVHTRSPAQIMEEEQP